MSTYNPKIHHRRSIRLKGYDYTKEGLYFITICCQDKARLWGDILDGEMLLNDAGRMVQTEWLKLRDRFLNIELHEFVVMPDHFHGILEIVDHVDAGRSNDLIGSTRLLDAGRSYDPIGSTLVVDPKGAEKILLGQPQGIDPTPSQGIDPTPSQGIDPTPSQGIDPTTPSQGIDPTPSQGIDPTTSSIGIDPTSDRKKTIGDMVGAFQSIVTVNYIRGVKNLGWKQFNKRVWQRNYYEHIIRNERSYQNISNYIINNPANWKGKDLNRK